MKTPAIFFGTPELAAYVLKSVHSFDYLDIVAVVTEPAKPAGRGRVITLSPVAQAARELTLPVHTPTDQNELIEVVSSHHPRLGLLFAYGRLLRPELLDLFPDGIVNIHPSLLPAYRGPSPVFWAIADGQTETGVSLMKLDAGCDTGPLLAQVKELILPADTTGSLTDRLVKRGVALLDKCLPPHLNGQQAPADQGKDGSLTRKLTKDDGRLNWSHPAPELERWVRACQPWPRAFTMWRGERLIISSAHVAGDHLVPDRVQPAGKKEMSWAAFCHGQRLSPLEAEAELRQTVA